MSFNEAIDKKYISNYELYLPVFESSQINEEIDILAINNNILLKLQFLIEAIKMCGTLKMIIYVKSHEEINDFIDNFNKINQYYCYDVIINKITCNENYNERNKILEEFNNSNKITLLLSVHILDEAIDIPSCNSIYMTYTSSSKIKNIQRMCRAMRYKPNKTAYIFLYCKELDESLEYISSIKEYDTDFITRINYLSVSENIKSKKERSKISRKYLEENKIKIIGIEIYRNEKWEEMLEKVKKYIDKNKVKPNKRSENEYEKKLGCWINHQQTQYIKHDRIMNDENIRNIWNQFTNNYKKYIMSENESWLEHLEKVKEYIDKYQKRPTLRKSAKREINISEQEKKSIIQLSDWLNHQLKNFKENKGKIINEEITNIWLEFLNHDKYKKYFSDKKTGWYDTLNEVIDYINEHKKKPTRSVKKYEQTKINNLIASWTETQIKNAKTRNQLMEDDEIYNAWLIFYNEYEEYFIDDSEKEWNIKFELVKQYKSINNKLPSHHDKDDNIRSFGHWIQTQKDNYKKYMTEIDDSMSKKKNIMHYENICNKWKKFIE
jgi:hypothetical protein